MRKKGRIFVISAPSGCGKTTICEEILKKTRNLARSVSFTTRPPRAGEKRKKDYHYVPRETFNKKIKKGGFLEWERNFGHLYGTPKSFVLSRIKSGKDVLLSIDVKGAIAVKKKFPESTLIFIKPPSMRELARRLQARKTDGKKEIKKRLKIAVKELEKAPLYDYTVINRDVRDAVEKILGIIKKPAGRTGREE